MPSALAVFRLMPGPGRAGSMSQLGPKAEVRAMSVSPSGADFVQRL